MSSKTFNNIPLSVLDLAPVLEGKTAADSFQNTIKLAQNVEKFGFNRFWMAEHHNIPGIASSATPVLISHVAGSTNEMRVGSGGIMLPNHSSLIVAEQFGTLESIYPGRIDLGLGRAPGTDRETVFAIRGALNEHPHDYPQQVEELEDYFAGTASVQSVPGTGLDVPLWLLGSSDFSAKMAAQKGLPYSFASHFAPDNTVTALDLYRTYFTPSETMTEPHAMIGVNVIAADTKEEANYLNTTQQQQVLNMHSGQQDKVQPPIDNPDQIWSETEKAIVQKSDMSPYLIVGTKEHVRKKLEELLEKTGADELIINSTIYDIDARIRSFEIVSELMD